MASQRLLGDSEGKNTESGHCEMRVKWTSGHLECVNEGLVHDRQRYFPKSCYSARSVLLLMKLESTEIVLRNVLEPDAGALINAIGTNLMFFKIFIIMVICCLHSVLFGNKMM